MKYNKYTTRKVKIVSTSKGSRIRVKGRLFGLECRGSGGDVRRCIAISYWSDGLKFNWRTQNRKRSLHWYWKEKFHKHYTKWKGAEDQDLYFWYNVNWRHYRSKNAWDNRCGESEGL